MFKPITLLPVLLGIAFTANLYSQENNAAPVKSGMFLPRLAVKTNLIYDMTMSVNLGGELRLSDYLTLDVSVNYNPWTFSDNRKFRHILLQPELRYWVQEPFNGQFFGTHLLYGYFNAGNLPLGSLRDNRYQGDAYGLGFSYGYQWILSPRWNLEAALGMGYMYLGYGRYECNTCGAKKGEGHKNYYGPSKTSLSLIYIIK